MKNKKLYSRALKILSRRNQSEAELKDKLCEVFSEEEVNELLSDFKKKKYIDEMDLADSIVRKLMAKSKGYYYIISTLRRRKIKEDIIERIANGFDYEAEFFCARKIFDEKLKKKKPSAALMHLKGRGFSYHTLERLANMSRSLNGEQR